MTDNVWRHTLSPGLVETLRKFACAVKTKNRNDIHVQDDLDLTHNEFGNYQKLRFFGVIAKVKTKEGKHIVGRWLLTHRGAQFLKGEISVPRWVKTQNNHIVEKAHEFCWIHEFGAAVGADYWQTDFSEAHPEPEHEEQLALFS